MPTDRQVTFAWPDESPRWKVTLVFQAVGGAVECVGVRVRPTAEGQGATVTSTIMRAIPFGRLIDRARRERGEEFLALVGARLPQSLGSLKGLGLGPLAAPVKRPGRRPHNREYIRGVADVYLASPSKPTKAVAETFNVAHSTAAKLVRRARDLGFIAPTTSGRTSGRVS